MKSHGVFEMAVAAIIIVAITVSVWLAFRSTIKTPTNTDAFLSSEMSSSTEESVLEDIQNSGGIVRVTFVRAENGIYNAHGTILAEVYYEKAVLVGNKDGVSLINNYFEREARAFYNGFDESVPLSISLPDFCASVEDKRKAYGDAELAHPTGKHPCSLFDTLDTELIYIAQDMISFKETSDWLAGGIHNTYFYGVTFDLNTGELLPFDCFVDIDADTFRENLASFLYDALLNWDYDVDMFEELLKAYGPNEDHNYDFDYYGEHLKLNYEYYYDGEHIYLILNNLIGNGGFIVKWNGKTGEAFDASFIWD